MKTKFFTTVFFTLMLIANSFSQKVGINLTVSIKNPTCAYGQDGEITALPSGGVGPYSYYWSNGDTTQTISNLVAGNYSVTVVDSYTNSISYFVNLVNPQPIEIISNTTNVTSFGLSNGSIDVVDVINENGPYTFYWNSSNGGSPLNQQSLDQTNLSAGYYKLTITDSLGCMGWGLFIITQPNPTLPVLNNPNLQIPHTTNNPSSIETYPNPSNGNITIDFKTNEGEYKITSLQNGLEIKSGKIYEEKINLNELPSGTYIINFQNGSEITRKIFVVI